MKKTPPRNPFPKRLTQDEIEEGKTIDYHGEGRPRVRSECGPFRPCPYVSCQYNLYLHVKANAKSDTLVLTFPDRDPTEMEYSCALDEADAHPDGMTLEEVGARMNITRERVRQLEDTILRKLRWAHEAHWNPQLQALFDVWDVYDHHFDWGWGWPGFE